MTSARRALPDLLAAGLVALAIFVWAGHAFLNYDSYYALAWGNELVHGRQPHYHVPVAPTPHPLATAVGAAVSLLGDAAPGVMIALVLLAVGALCVGVFRLGQSLFAWPVGLLGAAIVATRVPILDFGLRGYVDLPAAALIVWAAVLEARRRRRGAAVLVLLGLAGLLRPEAWLLAGAYWLWLAPALDGRARLRLAALAAAAPVLWALSDLVVTGDPFFSVNGTTGLASELGRKTGLGALPDVLPHRLGEILRLPELVAALLGLGAGLAWLRRRTLLPVAVAALNGLAFVVFAIADLPLLGRYLFVAAAMLALFAALAALGWTAFPKRHPARRRWRAAGAFVLAALVVFFATAQTDRLGDLRADVRAKDRARGTLTDLVDLVESKPSLEQCGPVYVPSASVIPMVAYRIDRRPTDVRSARVEAPPREHGVFIAATTRRLAELVRLDPNEPGHPRPKPPPTYRLVAYRGAWELYAACPPA